jgi:hypothetical protein
MHCSDIVLVVNSLSESKYHYMLGSVKAARVLDGALMAAACAQAQTVQAKNLGPHMFAAHKRQQKRFIPEDLS